MLNDAPEGKPCIKIQKTFEQNEDVNIFLVLSKYHILSFTTALQKLQQILMFSKRQIKLNLPLSSNSKSFHTLNSWFFLLEQDKDKQGTCEQLSQKKRKKK